MHTLWLPTVFSWRESLENFVFSPWDYSSGQKDYSLNDYSPTIRKEHAHDCINYSPVRCNSPGRFARSGESGLPAHLWKTRIVRKPLSTSKYRTEVGKIVTKEIISDTASQQKLDNSATRSSFLISDYISLTSLQIIFQLVICSTFYQFSRCSRCINFLLNVDRFQTLAAQIFPQRGKICWVGILSIVFGGRSPNRCWVFPTVLLLLTCGSAAADGYYKHTTKCYSCMSDVYLKAWPNLKYTYTLPANFSEQCNDNYDQTNIVTVDCPTICVVMIDETVIAGFSYFGFIRGCYDTMLQKGFNQTIVQQDGWLRMNTCRRYDRSHLLLLPHRTRHHHQGATQEAGIWLCACYGDKCNHGVPRFTNRATSCHHHHHFAFHSRNYCSHFLPFLIVVALFNKLIR